MNDVYKKMSENRTVITIRKRLWIMLNSKKILSLILCGLLYSSTAASYTGITVSADDSSLSGDVTNDGAVTASDLVKMKKYLTGSVILDEKALLNADMDNDGFINVIDCILLINHLLEPQVVDPPQTDEKTILLNGNTAEVTGTGSTVSQSTVTINEPGTYIVTGKLDNGQIIVDVDKTAYPDGVVELSLQGADITSTDNSPVYINSIADECVISVKKNTENFITDGTGYTNEDGDSGAVYSKDDLKFKGKGKLTVNGKCADGIVGKDSIKIFNGNITVNAVDDGIRGKDSVKIGDSDAEDFSDLSITVTTTTGDGIKATNDTDEGKGKIIINGGTVNVKSHGDAISSEQSVNIKGGTLDLYTYTGSGTASQSSSGGWGGMGGNTITTDVSAKGIKGVKLIEISGGDIKIDSTDDAVHGNGDVTISSGNMTIATGDDGIHADNILTVEDGTINITKSYEGLEAYDIEYKGGTTHITASDDGLNSAGGNDGSGTVNGGWNPGGMMSSSKGIMNISGGYIFMQAKGDGLDSNGPCNISGGTIVVNGFTSGDTSPLDADGGVTYTGGTLLAYGTSNMVVVPSKYSFVTTSATVSQGTTVTFTDESGKVLSTVTVPSGSNGNYLVYSSPTDNVKCYTGGTVSGATMFDNYYGEGGTISGGTEVPKGTANGGGFNPGFPRF